MNKNLVMYLFEIFHLKLDKIDKYKFTPSCII